MSIEPETKEEQKATIIQPKMKVEQKAMSIQPKIKIEFFDKVYGEADCIRMLLSHAKIDYEYVGYDLKQYEKLREEKGGEFK